MTAIIKRELTYYFKTLLGYIYIAFVLMVTGIMFTINLYLENGDYTQVIGSQMVMICLIFFGIPILTMRMMAEERQNQTEQLLLTSPVGVSSVILGKYAASLCVFVLALSLTLVQPFMMTRLSGGPIGEIISHYLGLLLLGGTFLAIGLLISSLTSQASVAAIYTYLSFFVLMFSDTMVMMLPRDRLSTLGILIGLVILISLFVHVVYGSWWISSVAAGIGVLGIGLTLVLFPNNLDGLVIRLIQNISLMDKYDQFRSGILDLSTVVYELSLIAFVLFITIQLVEHRRWQSS